MKNLDINSLNKLRDFYTIKDGKISIVFSTAEEGRSFNRHTAEGINELKSLINDFNISEVAYLQQVHSKSVFVFNKNDKSFNENEGDAIVTNELNTAIGVFTADCVPIILVDKVKGAVAAIHSGWKGTYNSIVKETVEKMIEDYNTDVNDINAYIGPHIRQCCYEISEELKLKFIDRFNVDKAELFSGRKLSMEKCIEEDLIDIGVNEDNIYSLGLCTHCDQNIKLHSYRACNGTYGRLFSFVFVEK